MYAVRIDVYFFCWVLVVWQTFLVRESPEMKKKKERFRLEEKDQRLDVRLTTSLRDRLEAFCRQNSKRLTDVITLALEEYLMKNEAK